MKSFIEENSNFIRGIIPTYRPWAEALSLYQVAVANPFARIVTRGPGMPITINPWAVGPSRFGYKSYPLKEIVEPTLKKAELYMLPPRFTVEGYYSFINKKKITHAALIRDETSGIVAESHKEYLADELTFLSELLDGRLSSRVTVSHGFMHGREIRVNFATATTPHVLTYLTADFWVQGLGNRLLPIYYTESVEDGIPADTEDTTFSGWIDHFAEPLKKMYETHVQWITMTKAVQSKVQSEEYHRRQKSYSDYFDDKLDIIPGLYFECQVFMQKIAALVALDRQQGENKPEITMEDYSWAEKWVNDRFTGFEQLVRDWVIVQNRKKTGTVFIGPAQKILRKLEKYKFGLTDTELNNLTHLTKEQRSEALGYLEKEGYVKKDTKFVDGIPKEVWCLKKSD
jgi:hypothetical protein